MLLGYCSLQVEVAGIGRANTNQRMLFPLVRTDRAESLIRRALPELPWPSQPLLVLPPRVHRRYLTLPLEYGDGFHPAVAVAARLVGAAGDSPAAAGLRARRRPGARGPMAGR